MIPGQAGANGAGNNILLGNWIWNHVKVTRYLCGACGFTEEWIDAKEDIEKIRRSKKVAAVNHLR